MPSFYEDAELRKKWKFTVQLPQSHPICQSPEHFWSDLLRGKKMRGKKITGQAIN